MTGPDHRRRRRGTAARWVAMVMMLVAAVLLAGCGSGSSSQADSSTAGALQLPADFPRADVPLIEGALLSAGGSAGEGWNLTVQGSSTITAALDAGVKKLTDAGYREVQRSTDGGNQVVVLTSTRSSTTYTVEVGSVAGAAGGPNSVFYQVSRS
ncbi:hypothetical protein [Williamsia herbipolensis]|uniref:hypothetical protein n=1 Tax=Williamsia herbipolensis TaxID=1603258 RepID=UPI0005F886B6|nr:hypothetical protein [Williamsia herbipolensis]